MRELEDRQKNTLWLDTLRNGITLDGFLWKGSPNATLVQRIGLGLFALLWLSPGFALLYFGFSEPAPVWFRVFMFVLALPWIAFGGKLLANAFRH